MSRPRVLLTGKSGFTGHYVAQELERRGYEVFGLSDKEHLGDPSSRRVDLLDRAAVADAVAAIMPDAVIHLAAISFVAHGDAEEVYRVNVVGTRNLLQALAEGSRLPEVVVLASSANIYGNAEVEPIAEETSPAPANDYAVSKLAMEYMARLWLDRLPIVFARPFNYTGVGQPERFLIPKIVSHFRRHDSVIELGNLDVSRDFSDVRDVATAYAQLVSKKPIGQTFNICSGVAHTLGEVLELASRLSGHQIEVRVNPEFVRAGEVSRLVGSNSKLREALGCAPTTPLEDTLSWMLQAS